MLAPVVTKRYAEALFAAAQEGRLVAETEADLAVLAEAVAEPAVASFLRDPTADAREQRARFLAPLEAQLKTTLVKNVTALCIDRRRAEVLLRLPKVFRGLALESRGEAEGIVEAARPLDEAAMNAVAERLGAALGRRVKLTFRLEPELLGGVRATVGSVRYDGSLKTRLSDLKGRLLAAPLPVVS